LHQYSFAKKIQSQNVTREKLRKALSFEKLLREDVDENDTWATMFPSLGILIVRQREGQDRAVSTLELSQRAREKEKKI
jgi:hypothetical protein